LKIALDEHVPKQVATALVALASGRGAKALSICSARDYSVPNSDSDVPWLQRFAEDGGTVVVSGDAKMRGKLHEQRALSDAGFVVFFMSAAWNRMPLHEKAAMLVRWWPIILEKISTASSGQFFQLPHNWTGTEMREVTPPRRLLKPKKLGKRKKS
jgi:hypothetical protein